MSFFTLRMARLMLALVCWSMLLSDCSSSVSALKHPSNAPKDRLKAILTGVQAYHRNSLHMIRMLLNEQNIKEDKKDNYIHLLIHVMDTDKNGYLNPNEVHSWIAKQATRRREEISEDLFVIFDDDADRLVNLPEFIEHKFQGIDIRALRPTATKREVLKIQELIFDSADIDKDQKLNRFEFFAAVFPGEVPRMRPAVLAHLRSFDVDNDGALSFDEVMTVAEQLFRDRLSRWKYARIFQVTDKNGDMILDGSELNHWADITDKSGDPFVTDKDFFTEDHMIEAILEESIRPDFPVKVIAHIGKPDSKNKYELHSLPKDEL